MAPLVSFGSLRARFERDEAARRGGGSTAEAAIAGALEAIGWRAAGEDAVEEVATLAVPIIAACVHGDHDVIAACRALADLLRRYAPGSTDALPPLEAFIPAAADVLRRYATAATNENRISNSHPEP